MNQFTARPTPDQLIVVDGQPMTIDAFNDRVSERLAQFAEPPHIVAARQKILGVRSRAAAERAEIDGTMRRFENFIGWFAFVTLAAMAARIGWAWHTGMLG